MELEVSAKTSYGAKPLVKKGYYPAQLLKIDTFKDSEGNLKEGKYGNQLILEFAVYKPGKKDEPTEIMKCIDKETNIESDVVIPKFVYHIYKDQKTGEKRTAISPKSAITRVFTALGWKFDASKPLKVDDFLNKWVEVNLDDYEHVDNLTDEKTIASTIKDINEYKGPTPTVGSSDLVPESDELDSSDLPE